MTEYDYSPEARERYIAKQHSIARWVSNTNRYEPANPFLPLESTGSSESPRPRQAYHSAERDGQGSNPEVDYFSSSRYHHLRDDRDRHQRPHIGRYDSHQSRNSSRQNSRSSSSRPSRHNSFHSPHPSQPSPAPRQTYQYPSPSGQQQNPYYDSIAHDPSGSSSSTPQSSTRPRMSYEQPPNIPTLIPIDGGNGGYVLVPPKGTSYQLVQPQSSHPTQPWFKRVFSPPLGEATGQRLYKSSSSSSHRRKWSWDIY